MALLERHTQLAELAAAHRDAAAGRGSVVAVTGEAGIGKTTLVRRFAADCDARALWGLCDDLVTPRPLGPFRDMFGRLRAGGDVAEFLDAVITDLERPPHPAVAVIDDAQWADQATLDALRFVGRRIGRMRALLVVSYRDDEVPADHPVRLAFGGIPAADVRRIRLRPLSRDAVARLACDGRVDADRLYVLTAGNPFFVREVLDSPGTPVPETVQDAVMARVGRLGSVALAAVEVACVVPARAETWLLDACGVGTGVDPASRMGVLSVQRNGTVTFANELARRAVEAGLAPLRRREINREVLRALSERQAEPARLTHHAVQAADAPSIAKFAPAAARRAAELESHRAAVAHYEQALGCPEQFDDDRLAELYEEHARECRLIAHYRQALDAVQWAMRLTPYGSERHGRCLNLHAELSMLLGQRRTADQKAVAAVALLERLPPGRALADAYAQRARLAMIDGHPEPAVEWGERARMLAVRLGDRTAQSHIDITLGVAQWQLDPGKAEFLVDCLERSRAAGLAHPTARAYVNLAHGYTRLMRYGTAYDYIEEGVPYCIEHDQLLNLSYLLRSRAVCHLDGGRWFEAEQDVAAAVDTARAGYAHDAALWIRALVQARRGDPSAPATVAELDRLAERAGTPESLLRAWSARAELMFLSGRRELPDPRAVLDHVMARRPWPWSRERGDAALCLARAGMLVRVPDGIDEPRALQIEGRWREAASAWQAVGRPYDQADALGDADEPDALLAALEILDRLGAAPRAAMVRRRLTALGAPEVPRGPRRATRSHPAGLTPRQAEVLGLLAMDLTYQEIADRLQLSIKTVDHHVTALRTKLDVTSRRDVVAAGHRLGILEPQDRDVAVPT